MKLMHTVGASLALALMTIPGLPARSLQDAPAGQANGLANSVVLVIRHAEKPLSGNGLTLQGQAHARAYVDYFRTYKIKGHPLHLNYLVATADTPKSARERLTIEPLSKALKLPIDNQFADDEVDELANALRAKSHGKQILICWHHGKIPKLVAALGGDADALIPGGKWPADQFNWVIQLSYDKQGHIIPSETRRIEEQLRY